ncbi:MAG: triple tyrosine motif-containing protein, partial [Saprospiraceae bacterium]
MRNQLLFFLILFLPNSLLGQTEEVYVYDQVDGLFPTLTTHVTQCNQGYIWTLNDGLINRFDGQNFWTYPSPSNHLLGSEEKLKGLCSYQDSLLFLHSDNYLFLLNPELNEWQSFPMVNDYDTADYTIIEFQQIGENDIILHCLKNNEFDFLRFRNQKIEPIEYTVKYGLFYQAINDFRDLMQNITIEEENGNILDVSKVTAMHPWLMIDSLENKYIVNDNAILFFDSLGKELGFMPMDSICGKFHCRKSFMQLDPQGRINIVVSGLLGIYNIVDSALMSHEINQFKLFSDSNKIKSFFFEPNENMWIFDDSRQLVYYNAKKNTYNNYGDIFNSDKNNWHAGFQDKSKVVWLASDLGLAKIQPRTSFFSQLVLSKKDTPPVQSDKTIPNIPSSYSPFAGMTEDKECNIYGINEENIFKVDSENKDTLSVLFRNVDRSMDLLSTEKGFLLSSGRLLNTESGEIIKIQNSHPPLDDSPIAFSMLYQTLQDEGTNFKIRKNENYIKNSKRFYSDLLLKDKDQEIWRANDSTLYFLDQSGKDWIWKEVIDTLMRPKDRENFEAFFRGKYEDIITSFCIGKHSNKLWMGYRSGRLLSYSLETKKLERTDMVGLELFLKINAIEEDSNGKLWLATDNGLYHVDPLTEDVKIYNEKDGLCHKNILGMLSEGDSCYWLATERGLSRFHISTNRFMNFFEKDGLPSNNFDLNSYFQTKDGQMFFSTRGEVPTLISFFPQEVFKAIEDLSKDAQLVLSSFEFADGDRDTIINRHNLANNSTIELGHNTKFLAFQYALTDFQSPRNIHYSYQLKGYEDSWSKPSISNNVRFGSLPPGEYTFHAKARDHHMIWHPSQFRMTIIINPPWWKTVWAYLGYVVFLSGFSYFIFSFVKRRLELQAQLKREQEEALRLKELDNFKSKLYTNLTHEFRTPLTVILGMVQQIRNEPKKYLDEGTRMIETNGRNLLRLVNQLLDLSKLEDRSFKLKLQQSNIIPYIKYITESFHTFVNSK